MLIYIFRQYDTQGHAVVLNINGTDSDTDTRQTSAEDSHSHAIQQQFYWAIIQGHNLECDIAFIKKLISKINEMFHLSLPCEQKKMLKEPESFLF